MADVNGRLRLIFQVSPKVRREAADLLERLQEGPIALGRKGIRHPGGAGGLLLVLHTTHKVNGGTPRTIELRPDVSPGYVVFVQHLLRKKVEVESQPAQTAD